MISYEVCEATEMLEKGEFQQAADLLLTVGEAERDARWYYEYSRANAGLERFYEAAVAARKAHEAEPECKLYRKQWAAYKKKKKKGRPEKKEDNRCFNCCDGVCNGCDACDCFSGSGCGECCGEICCEGCCEGLCSG